MEHRLTQVQLIVANRYADAGIAGQADVIRAFLDGDERKLQAWRLNYAAWKNGMNARLRASGRVCWTNGQWMEVRS